RSERSCPILNDSFTLIKDKVKMMDVVDGDLNLKRNGRVYKALCPFHNERTPSFTVYPKNQSFHCFGCERSGTIIDYVMYRDNIKEQYVTFKKQSEENNVTITGFDKETIKKKRETINKNRDIAVKGLGKRKKANDFLLERGFNQDTTYKFGIGFDEKQNA